ncbi:MAG: hypothetical protein KGI39_03925, partial [Patescibacteria group bacterium]|nr:hypothetical protein [Patescibacteria group bacterium]
NKKDYSEFCKSWKVVHELMPGGKSLSDAAMALCFESLAFYPLADVKKAIAEHAKNEKFAPSPNDIINILDADKPVHIGADEAWSIARHGMDQKNSVCITQEILAAMDIASDVYSTRDENPARMAFRDAYNRIVKTAPTPKWFVSVGEDKAQAEMVALEGIRLGRLPHGADLKYRIEPPTTTAQKLIEGYVQRVGVREDHMAKIKSMLKTDKIDDREQRKIREREIYDRMPTYLQQEVVIQKESISVSRVN